jgi:hypothetical protein
MAKEPAAAEAEFFEKKVRPLLADHCWKCHGDKVTKGGLSLSSREDLLEGGETGPAAVPGKPEKSLFIQALHYKQKPKMPPGGKRLPEREIVILTQWVKMGLPWPKLTGTLTEGQKFQITAAQRSFWSFQPVKRLTPPTVHKETWVKGPLDRFILAKLEDKGLKPARPADKRTLLRRATFDLTGLPPTPEEIDAFLRDQSPGAFARVVDSLLASPHYGERWGRHWLDVVRYTDSFDSRILAGPGAEMDITESWRYRDWVVDALNRDLPYDRFVADQIAGDLLPAGKMGQINRQGIIATGMLAIGNWGGGDADKEKLLTDIVDDQIDVVSRAFLGLTISCARCHDHKFDPISNADYYGLAGIFFSTHILPNVGPKTNGPPMLRIPLVSKEEIGQREGYQKRLAELENKLKQKSHPAALSKIRSELENLKKNPPAPVAFANGAQEGGVPGSPHAGVHDVRIHLRGSYTRLGEMVPRRFPVILAGEKQPPITRGSGRLELARWIASPDNPLTARVMVNRLWQHHFGEGIVRTPSNLGKLGERPSHPELLDYLAQDFVQSGWSLKQMHRRLMLSATYQQASEPDARTLKADPDNRLFGRMNRRRLEAEAIRDNLLATAGRLQRNLGGPATRTFAVPRRTLYLLTVRSDRSGFRPLFDVADSTAPVEKRVVSTVAPQALFLLNHPFVLEQTQALIQQILAGKDGDKDRIQRAYVRLFGRPATEVEAQIGLDLLNRSLRTTRSHEAAWKEYCQVLLCTNEFIYVD